MLEARRETQEGLSHDYVATDSGERNQGDGEDLGRHHKLMARDQQIEGSTLLPYMPLRCKGHE